MLRELARSFAKRWGYEIYGPPRAYATQRSLAGLLRQEKINLVLDVGANLGQFVDELWAAGYTGQVVSFEPLASAHAQLVDKARRYPNWTIADRTAVGARTGAVDINISGNSVSSSVLPMLPSHSRAEPHSAYVGTETVPMHRLDDLYSLSATDRAVLKIDVQGYEKEVLQGATEVLASCRAVITEMSLVPLYESQVLARELWDFLVEQGFEAWSVEPGFRDPITGRLLQLDGIFVRAR